MSNVKRLDFFFRNKNKDKQHKIECHPSSLYLYIYIYVQATLNYVGFPSSYLYSYKKIQLSSYYFSQRKVMSIIRCRVYKYMYTHHFYKSRLIQMLEFLRKKFKDELDGANKLRLFLFYFISVFVRNFLLCTISGPMVTRLINSN